MSTVGDVLRIRVAWFIPLMQEGRSRCSSENGGLQRSSTSCNR